MRTPVNNADVLAFLAALRAASAAVAASHRSRRLADVVPAARSGAVPDRGRAAGGVRYQVHGAGCAITDGSGREVDVDFLPDGTPIFDAWRLRTFIESTGRPVGGTDADVLAVCRDMVASGLLSEPRSGWFAPPDGP